MNVGWRAVQRIYYLLQDCGMPSITPSKDLLQEIYWMLEEAMDEYGVPYEKAMEDET